MTESAKKTNLHIFEALMHTFSVAISVYLCVCVCVCVYDFLVLQHNGLDNTKPSRNYVHVCFMSLMLHRICIVVTSHHCMKKIICS